MRNLYQRLKPEYKEDFDLFENYKTLNILVNNHIVSDLRLCDVIAIQGLLKGSTELIDTTWIYNIFERE